jgi:integrase
MVGCAWVGLCDPAAVSGVSAGNLMLGHSDAAMTLNIYGHLFPDRLDEVVDVLDARRTAAVAGMAA